MDQRARRPRGLGKQGDTVRSRWAEGPGALDTKDGIGFLHVPAMDNGEVLVKKGTDPENLNNGIAGYYTDPVKSALPWDDKGNFTLAAHRDGHGAKFHNIHKLKNGDAVVFETKDTWYVYKVYKTLPETSKFNVEVIQPVPEESGVKKPGRYITLTTCTPVYTSKYRYIVWGELERTEKVDKDRTKLSRTALSDGAPPNPRATGDERPRHGRRTPAPRAPSAPATGAEHPRHGCRTPPVP